METISLQTAIERWLEKIQTQINEEFKNPQKQQSCT